MFGNQYAPPDDLNYYRFLASLKSQDGTQMEGFKNDPPLSPSGPYGHGQDGLFNIPGTNDAVFGAMILPQNGALGAIPVYNGDQQNTSMFGGEEQALDTILTGVTSGDADDFDNQPTEDCADGPEGGLTKLCTFVNPFGRYRFSTREVSMVRAGQRLNRADPLTLRLMNAPAMGQLLGVPANTPSAEATLANEISRRIWETAVSARRMLGRRIWIGTPANNNGEARDIVGLNLHINENNKIDYKAQTTCTAANSDIYNFGYDDVGGSGRDIVEYVEMAEDHSTFKSDEQGLTPVEGWIFMRPELWREVSGVWPIRQYQQYLTQMANYSAAGRVVVTANEADATRTRMRQAMQLPVNGRLYQVVTDNSMVLQTPTDTASLSPGEYAADMVFVPRSVLGGVPVTFFEYYNHDNQQSMGIQQLAGGSMTFTSDGGLIRWYVNFKNGCIKLGYELSPRLKVKTPQIGWRINNIKFSPLKKYIDPYPDSSYFVDGGVTNQDTDDAFYTSWSTDTPVDVPSS